MHCPTCGVSNPETQSICLSCGAPLAEPDPTHLLSPGAVLLGGIYLIDRLLGQGGFGLTYVGRNTLLQRPVAIKEFFPDGCTRQGPVVRMPGRWKTGEFAESKNRFLEEARTLAQFNHPGIVRVHNAFEENNTAYMVMELLEGRTLKAVVVEQGPLTEAEAIQIAEAAGDALETVHGAGLLHRDIKPDNLMRNASGRLVLIDFGSAKEFIAGATQSHSLTLTPGYAPLEQYAQRARRGPHTDVYALGATLYYLLAGEEPPAATDRAAGVLLTPLERLNRGISPSVSRAILRAMEMRIEDRPPTVEAFLRDLHDSDPSPREPSPESPRRPSSVETVPPEAASPAAPTWPPPPHVSRSQSGIGCEILLAGCAVAILFFFVTVMVLLLCHA